MAHLTVIMTITDWLLLLTVNSQFNLDIKPFSQVEIIHTLQRSSVGLYSILWFRYKVEQKKWIKFRISVNFIAPSKLLETNGWPMLALILLSKWPHINSFEIWIFHKWKLNFLCTNNLIFNWQEVLTFVNYLCSNLVLKINLGRGFIETLEENEIKYWHRD